MEKAIVLWGQVYADGDKYVAPEGRGRTWRRILPADKEARMKALAPLVDTMPKDEFDQLIAELFTEYTP